LDAHEGTNNIAFALISFESLAAYESYRARLRADKEGVANFNFARRQQAHSRRRADIFAAGDSLKTCHWRLTPRLAIFTAETRRERNHAGHDCGQRAAFRKLARQRMLHHSESFDVAIRPAAAASRLQGAGVDQRGLWPGPLRKPITASNRRRLCDHLTALCAAVDLPVNADFEAALPTTGETWASMSRAG